MAVQTDHLNRSIFVSVGLPPDTSPRHQRLARYLRQTITISAGPVPWRGMLHLASSVVIGASVCAFMGQLREVGIVAFAILYVYFLDFRGSSRVRYPTILLGLLAILSLGFLGHLLAPYPLIVLALLLGGAIATGWAHGAGPRTVQIFRFGTVAFLITSVTPVIGFADLPYVAIGIIAGLLVAADPKFQVPDPQARQQVTPR